MANTKLYPPLIEGTIPAFYGTTLRVPFSFNKANNISDIGNIIVRLKGLNSNSEILIDYMNPIGDISSLKEAVFDLTDKSVESKLQSGKYYKIQMAFVDTNGQIGYYSQVATIKYTSKPTIELSQIANSLTYRGTYINAGDSSEKLHWYQFDLYLNSTNQLIESSGQLLHNNITNENNYNEYTIKSDLKPEVAYKLVCSMETINGLKLSGYEIITSNTSVNPVVDIKLRAAADSENGCMVLSLDTDEEYLSGQFIVSRSDGNRWIELMRFGLNNTVELANWQWRDYTVEQGKRYQYAIQQYNKYGLISNRIELNAPVIAEFEHMYLQDENKYLKIKFNPKISTFKNDILESKQDTIGGKHPFIFRNGSVKYKEFAISGLVSCKLNDNKLFNDMEQTDSINLSNENLKLERDFKLDVLEWLNNGKPKLFRSATEGNYIVRLLNVSMSPNDTLGRMLHTFTATAYEIMEYNYENLVKCGFIKPDAPEFKVLQWHTFDINDIEEISGVNMVAFVAEGLRPGETLRITEQGVSPYDVVIDESGYYEISLQQGKVITALEFPNPQSPHTGQITYAYWINYINSSNGSFDNWQPAAGSYTPSRASAIAYGPDKDLSDNIGTNRQFVKYTSFSATRKEMINIVRDGNKYYYYNYNGTLYSPTSRVVYGTLQQTSLYRVYTYDTINNILLPSYYYVGANEIPVSAIDYSITIDDIPIAIGIQPYTLVFPIDINTIGIGNGIVAEYSYTYLGVQR